MTNYEAIKAMDQHELAEFLASFMPCSDCLVSEELCDAQGTCTAAILAWLSKETKDDTTVEHCSGKTINISHANVVIID